MSTAGSADQWRDLARKIEALGYSSIYIPDHFDEQLSPLVALTVAAEVTDNLKVGSLVFDNDYRHPLVLAREIATLDLLSSGRVECGIGAGWMTSDYIASGIALDEPPVRVERLEEAVEILKQLWTNDSVSYSGKHYTLKAARGFPKPVQSPHPKIVIGGGSPKVLRLAAKQADIVGINMRLSAGVIGSEVIAEAAPEKFDARIKWVREAAGSRIEDIEIQCLTFIVQVVPNGNEVRERVAPLFGMTPEIAAQVPVVLVGSEQEICETLQERRERWGYSYIIVHEQEMEEFAPVVALLEGK
ncbi:MAG: TIGR03621 family F420-dependent LLM class oxidoreductase [Acidimicrobiales bacterium]|nr:TIGR03621 family F420-dependent LLM class oxidoreductase [Acidimicrobiales bacterium]